MKTRMLVLATSTLVLALATVQGSVIGAAVTQPGPPRPGQLPRNLPPTPSPDELRVFYQAPDGALATTWAVGPWSTPVSIAPVGAAQPNSPIAAAINDRFGTFQAYYIRSDGAVGRARQVGGPWRADVVTRPGTVRNDSPLAVFKHYGDIWLVFLAPDGAISIMLEDTQWGWIEHVTVAPLLRAGDGTGLAAITDPSRYEWHAVYQATSTALVDFPATLGNRLYPGLGKGVLYEIASPGAAHPKSPIAVLARADARFFGVNWFHLFFVGPDGAVMTKESTVTSQGTRLWNSAKSITPPGAAREDSPLAAVLRGDQLHVFYVGPDGAVATAWQAVGPWQKPFPITPLGAGRPGSSIAVLTGR